MAPDDAVVEFAVVGPSMYGGGSIGVNVLAGSFEWTFDVVAIWTVSPVCVTDSTVVAVDMAA